MSECAETQTEDVDMMRCDECDYPAQDICDLGAHIYEVHGSEGFEDNITCNYCHDKFNSKDSLMVHRKNVHMERVSICSNFLNGACYFESDECWYLHTKPSVMLRCKFCENNSSLSTIHHMTFKALRPGERAATQQRRCEKSLVSAGKQVNQGPCD